MADSFLSTGTSTRDSFTATVTSARDSFGRIYTGVEVTSTNPSPLRESDINNATLTCTLNGTTYRDPLLLSHFSLVNPPPGTTISSVSRTSSTVAVLTLSYDFTDFDDNYEMEVRVLPAGTVSTLTLTSDTVTVISHTEAASISSTNPVSLTETNLDKSELTVTVSGTTWVATPTKAMFDLEGEPDGTTISDVSRTDNSNIILTLAYDNTDFDSNHNMRVTMTSASTIRGHSLSTATVLVSAVVETAAAKPAGLTATAAGSGVDLKWTNPNDALITGYEYQQRLGTATVWPSTWEDIEGSGSATVKYEIRNLTRLTEYDFRIRALRPKANPSTPSDLASATTLAAPPSFAITSTSPSSLTENNWNNAVLNATLTNATFVDFVPVAAIAPVLSVAKGSSEARMVWLGYVNTTITGFEYQTRTGSSWPDDWTAMTGVTRTSTLFTVKSLTNDTAYEFRMRVVQTGGQTSEVSNVVSATPSAESVTISSTNPASLMETNISGAKLTITLTGVTFDASLSRIFDFDLITGVPEIGLSDLTRTSDTVVVLALGYSSGATEADRDFDTDQTISIRVKTSGISGYTALTTGTVTVTAVDEPIPLKLMGITGRKSTASGRRIISWTTPTDQATFTNYQYQSRALGSVSWTGTETIVNTGLANIFGGTTTRSYGANRFLNAGIYRMRAVNAHGAGPWSDDVTLPA